MIIFDGGDPAQTTGPIAGSETVASSIAFRRPAAGALSPCGPKLLQKPLKRPQSYQPRSRLWDSGKPDVCMGSTSDAGKPAHSPPRLQSKGTERAKTPV